MAWSVGGEARTGLQVIWTLKLLSGLSQWTGTLEKVPAKREGERRMFWGEIRTLGHTPGHHQAVPSVGRLSG